MANFRHSQKWTQTRNLNFAYTTPRTNSDYSAYKDHVAGNFTSFKFVNSKPINFKFGDMIKFHEPHLHWKFEKNRPQEHELSTMKVPPIHSYGNFGFHFLTMWTRRCLKRHWRHDKKIAYSRNAKITHTEVLDTYSSHNFSTSGFELPLPWDFEKGWPKVSSWQNWEKSAKGNWNYKEIKFCQW